ncbi:MAG TPA: hypothetical protein VHM02_15440 [Thermoanaerobaculia bacterium]|nr:hypothetical protein [Thermoanaerobaculia bacterium]
MIAWARNDCTPTDGGWTPRLLDDVFPSPRTLELGDLDGELDVLAGSAVPGSPPALDDALWRESDGTPLADVADLGNGQPLAAAHHRQRADVVFRAGDSVAFHDGFVVREFASFRVEIAAPAECGGP